MKFLECQDIHTVVIALLADEFPDASHLLPDVFSFDDSDRPIAQFGPVEDCDAKIPAAGIDGENLKLSRGHFVLPDKQTGLRDSF